MNKFTLFLMMMALCMAVSCSPQKRDFIILNQDSVCINLPDSAAPVISTAAEILMSDLANVLDCREDKQGKVISVTLADLGGKKEAFIINARSKDSLEIVGSDPHGAAFGLMEVSRLLGVSPWEWWADSAPDKLQEFSLKQGIVAEQSPSVAYRGIFINDEDFALNPWAWKQFEPSDVPGQIGSKTNSKIFELLLRLKANSYWPAMHGCSIPFFLVEGNREAAKKYGIYIGTSHCEPMASNANGEWAVRGHGEYNFISNRENVLDFWKERVESVSSQEIIYTLGMRGIHDGPMEGAGTPEEQKMALEDVIESQRNILAECINEDLSRVPQVFIPYKEVLNAYNEGLEVPEDVMLMWCDDNYGYIRHFPSEEERSRSGGNGIYYHVSYWGRPHDYLWLGTISPALVYQQMGLAYDKGIKGIWILNVGDIKPEEYQIELFMDMAWDIDAVRETGLEGHMRAFLSREFGESAALDLVPVMKEHYRLAFIRKPEFLGNTREEETDPAYRIVKDLPWDQESINNRLDIYAKLYDAVEKISAEVPKRKQTTYFHLVQYPVQATAKMNEKILKGQLARHAVIDWSESDKAYDEIQVLTERYNVGKWTGMMNCSPRNLPVFSKLPHDMDGSPMTSPRFVIAKWNAVQCSSGSPIHCEGLGYESGAAVIPAGKSVSFSFDSTEEEVIVSVRMIPTHPVSSPRLRYTISVDGGEPDEFSYETYDRSEEWKENVLNNQSVRESLFRLDNKSKAHTITFKAMDEGEILDQIYIIRKDTEDNELALHSN